MVSRRAGAGSDRPNLPPGRRVRGVPRFHDALAESDVQKNLEGIAKSVLNARSLGVVERVGAKDFRSPSPSRSKPTRSPVGETFSDASNVRFPSRPISFNDWARLSRMTTRKGRRRSRARPAVPVGTSVRRSLDHPRPPSAWFRARRAAKRRGRSRGSCPLCAHVFRRVGRIRQLSGHGRYGRPVGLDGARARRRARSGREDRRERPCSSSSRTPPTRPYEQEHSGRRFARDRRLVELHPKEALHHSQLADAYLQGGVGEAAR